MKPISQQPVDSLAVFPTLMKFQAEGRFCDVTVQVGEESFRCNRSLLAAMSEFFETMFQSDFKEGRDDNDEPIVLHEVHPLAFKEILNLMHTNDVNVDNNNVHLLLQANNFLQLRTTFMEERCFLFLYQEVKSGHRLSHAFDVLSFASLTRKLRFVHLMCDHILEYVHQFAKDDRFMEIPLDILITLLARFKFKEPAHANTDKGRGNTLLNIILCWLNHSRATRSQYRDLLMRTINSSCISMDYALSLLNEHEHLIDKAADGDDREAKWFANLYNPGMIPEVDLLKFATGTTCRFRIQNLSEVHEGSVKVSPPYKIRDLLWRMGIQRSAIPQNFRFFVYFDGDRDTCRAKVNFMIVSQKNGVKNVLMNTPVGTYARMSYLCFPSIVTWDDLINEEKGYIKDDCVIFQIHVSF